MDESGRTPEQPAPPHRRPDEPCRPDHVDDADDWGRTDVASAPMRPGEPHPHLEERRPPNLWLLVIMTAISLVVAAAVMALTLL